jgi:hypothetical protein
MDNFSLDKLVALENTSDVASLHIDGRATEAATLEAAPHQTIRCSQLRPTLCEPSPANDTGMALVIPGREEAMLSPEFVHAVEQMRSPLVAATRCVD